MKVALVHDHLAQLGGAEKVLQALAGIYPSASIYTLLYKPENIKKFFPRRDINTSFIQKMPLGISKYQWYLPLMAAGIESLDLSNYDLVISSASSFAKGIIIKPGACHVCYCHTPTRYLWHYSNQYIEELRLPKIIKKFVALYISNVRQWDSDAARRVDYFVANSLATQERIKKYYLRESEVIHPPVDTHKFYISKDIGNYFLIGGRLTPYKRFDLAIEAFNHLNLKLKIFGIGPDWQRLRKMAGKNIEFLGQVSENEKAKLLSQCRAFIHPQEEDFGITAVEANASGRPVIAYGRGGARETIIDNATGILFFEQNWEDLADAVIRFIYEQANNFDPPKIKNNAEKFSLKRFEKEITRYINTKIKQ